MSDITSLHDKLLDIQQKLEVPKSRENEFGGFNYRNIEDIEEKVKPFLKIHNLILTFSDEIIGIEGRVYVKATALLSDGKEQIAVSAHAREAVAPKKKTDDSQLTGGCSSYARKYAVQGMFLIDDGKSDPDRPQVAPSNDKLAEAKAEVFAELTDRGIVESQDMIRIIKETTGSVTIKSVSDANKVLEYLRKDDERDRD